MHLCRAKAERCPLDGKSKMIKNFPILCLGPVMPVNELRLKHLIKDMTAFTAFYFYTFAS